MLFDAIGFALFLFWLFLLARIAFGYVLAYSREWKPTGLMLVLVESVYTVTDPPLKFLRSFIPPLTIGQFRVDIAIMVLFLLVFMAMSFVRSV